MKKIVTVLLVLIYSVAVQAQDSGRGCATTEAQKLLIQRYPAYAKRMSELEAEAQTLSKSLATLRTQHGNDSIPVVFHIIYHTPEENITDAQLLSQLVVLNEDYNRKNADASKTPSVFLPVAGNPQLHFCLARLDPNGDPTTGITRTQTSRESFHYTDNDVKFKSKNGEDAWNPELYLNIWICNLADGVLGYAQFPGGPPETDGIVLKYTSVGRAPLNPFPSPYNLGRTATHEIGHWLGLHHIWGDQDDSCSDSDFIDDTPNQEHSTSDCPSFPQISCGNGPNGNMFMNFMDYTNDACMNLFTVDQSNKMNSELQTAHRSILSSNVCTNVINADFRAVPDAVLPGQSTNFYYYSNGRRPTSFSWTFEGATPSTSTDKNPQNINYSKPGAYTVSLTVSDAFGTDTETKIGYLKVTTDKLQAYPNPANEEVNIGAPAGQKLRMVSIYNSVGQLVFETFLSERTLILDTRNFENGIYIVRGLTDTGNKLSLRVVVMHST